MQSQSETINQQFAGKVFSGITISEDDVTINFTDGSHISIELDSVNESCHCHPEYRYYLDVGSYDAKIEEEHEN